MKHLFLLLAVIGGLFVPGAPQAQVQAKNTWRVMSYNIRNARGMDNVIDFDRVADVINRSKPDIATIQEIDSMTARSGQTFALEELARRCLMHPVYAPAIDYDGGKYGIGMLSKEKPLSSRYIPLPGREEQRALLMVEFKDFIMACAHLSLKEEDRLAAVAIIKDEAKKYAKPFFITGDLNARPESPVIVSLQEGFTLLTDPKKPTSPSTEPRNCIDYIAISNNAAGRFTKLADEVVNEPMASDHRPVMVDIRMKAEKEDIFYCRPYLQNPVGNGITVMWQTNVPTYSWVEYGTDSTSVKRVHTLVDGQVICNGLHNKIRLEGLQAGQKYYYRVCSREITLYKAYKKEFGETAVSPFYSFTLPSANTADFTAIIFNDLHKQEATLDALYAQVKDIPYDFVVFNGDCIDDPATEEEALYHIRMQCQRVGASRVPAFYLRGNHEIRNAYSIGLRELFDYVGDKTYGAFNWGDTRIVMLDCGEDKPDTTWVYYGLNDFTQLRLDQVDFLKQELSSKDFKQAKKRVLLNHIPLFSTREGGYNPSADLWKGLLAKAPFDINISAHTHRYTYYPKGEAGNNFPVVVGGSQRIDTSTVMVLQKKGKDMTLKVLNTKGETLYDLKL